jgi:hypothetical protein
LAAVEVIGKRPDLEVTKADKDLAKSMNVDLDKYIKPTDTIFKEQKATVTTEAVVAEVEDADKYNEIFKKVFSA